MGGLTARRRSVLRIRAMLVVLIAVSVLAPKISLATASLFGGGFRSVIICTGGGLKRVTIAPDGSLVEDVTEAWVGSHCVLTEDDVDALQRQWSALRLPLRLSLGAVPIDHASLPPRERHPSISSRGPPAR